MALLNGTQVIAKIVPVDSEDVYPTHDDFYGLGGYSIITSGFNALTAAGPNAIPRARQKIGQIVFDQVNDKHYQIRTVGDTLSAPFSMRGAWPHQYEGSFRSTSFAAKNANNVINSFFGSVVNNTLLDESFVHSAILAGSQNRLSMDAGSQSYSPQIFGTTIVGGSANIINGVCSYGSIGGGQSNYLNASPYTVVAGGRGQYVSNTSYGFVGGGQNNLLGSLTYAAGNYSIIVGGLNNQCQGIANFLGGGQQNFIRGTYNSIVGGFNNRAAGQGDIVVGGQGNQTFGVSEPGTILFTKNYTNVRYEYAKDTKLARLNNVLVETIPGAQDSGQEAAGIAQIYAYTKTYNDHLTGRPIVQTLTSNVPTASGRFGHSLFFVYSRTGSTQGLVLGEPGSNKVHLYTFSNNAASTFTRVQVLDLNTIDTSSPPASSLFGYSIHFMDQGLYSPKTIGSPYSLLVVGAPGNDAAYVFKVDKAQPFNSDGAYVPFTLLAKLTGESGSEFGHDVKGWGYWNDSKSEFLSAAYVAVGAPNKITPYSARTGAVEFFRSFMAPGYTYTSKQFTDFTKMGDSFNGESPNYYRMKPNERYGDTIHSFSVQIKSDGIFSSSIAQLANSTPLQLSSYFLFYYVNMPNKSMSIYYKQDPSTPGRLLDQSFTYDTNYTVPLTSTGVVSVANGWLGVQALSAGSVTGKTFYLTGGDESSPYVEGGYGQFSILGQGFFTNLNYQGPNQSTVGIYDIPSILSATNYQWQSPNSNHRANPEGTQYESLAYSVNPRNQLTTTNTRHPGYCVAGTEQGELGYTFLFPPFPTSNYNVIERYGFANIKIPGTDLTPGFATFYFISAGVLSYANAALDLPGDTVSSSVMVGGRNNVIRGKDSAIFAGTSNTIQTNIARGLIVAGTSNLIQDTTNSGTAKQNSVIVTGTSNRIDGSEFSAILNGSNNRINQFSNFSAILNGANNTISQNTSGVYILASNVTASQRDTVYINNLIATDHIQAKTKSFTVKHPTKKGKTLNYGSLESPYHGIRLTGIDTIKNNKCIVKLPDYVSSFVHRQDVNIQLTNFGHNKRIYVDQIDIPNNRFLVRLDGFVNKFSEYDFFWSFTAVRKDVPKLVVES